MAIALFATLGATWATGPVAAQESPPPALVIEEGSIARRQVVALGRDLVVAGEAQSDVAAIDGSIEVSGKVLGDVIVMGGNATLEPSARVEGDVFVIGGTLNSGGAFIGGRAVSYPTMSAAWMTLLEGPDLGRSPLSPLVLGSKLALLAAWLLATLLLLAVGRREVLNTSEAVAREPLRSFVVGLTGVLALALTALFFSAFASQVVGVPLMVLVAVAALLLKLWGMVAIFHAAGEWLGERSGRYLSPMAAAVLGLAALGVLKLVPWLGGWVWTAATLLGVGATLITKFGRLEPWFEPEAAPAGRYS